MSQHFQKLPGLIMVLIILSSCASRPTTKEIHATVPNCQNAQEQVKMLHEEMVTTQRRALAGVTSVVPSLAALTLIAGQYPTNFAIATGEYEKALDKKINEIEQTCGLGHMSVHSDQFSRY